MLKQFEVKNIFIGEWEKPDYLCFTANTAGSTIKLGKAGSPTTVTLETSTDRDNWSTYTFWDVITLTNIWDSVYWRNTSETTTWFSLSSAMDYYHFVMTWSIAWSWDINFLINKHSTKTLVSHHCYVDLFNSCSQLTTPPELPATTLTSSCYLNMFNSCSNLTKAPKLPATTLASSCYNNMFIACTKLEELPELPALTLPTYCYYQMFYWCSKIKISSSQSSTYATEYRIPKEWTWTQADSTSVYYMFYNTWGSYATSPSINTTYYTSNTVV